MKEVYKDCKPNICNRSELMSEDWTFMTKEILKEKCDCASKSVCFEILRLLKDWHRPEAEELIK